MDSATRPLSSYQVSHRMCLNTEELALRSAIYASLADSMVASVIEELSPKDERSKLLREKLAIIQEAQVSAVSADFASASNLQLLRRDALLKNFGFQPQVLSSVRMAPFERNHVVGPKPKVLQTVYVPSGKLTWWQARLWLSPRSIESPRPARKWRHPRRRLLELQSLTAWGPRPPRLRALRTQEPPFRAGAGRARPRPFQGSKKSGKASSSTSTRQRWRVPGGGSPGRLLPRTGGVCWATARPPASSRTGHYDLCPVDSCVNLLSALDSRNGVMSMRTSPHLRALLVNNNPCGQQFS